MFELIISSWKGRPAGRASRKSRPRNFRPGVELLEARAMLTAVLFSEATHGQPQHDVSSSAGMDHSRHDASHAVAPFVVLSRGQDRRSSDSGAGKHHREQTGGDAFYHASNHTPITVGGTDVQYRPTPMDIGQSGGFDNGLRSPGTTLDVVYVATVDPTDYLTPVFSASTIPTFAAPSDTLLGLTVRSSSSTHTARQSPLDNLSLDVSSPIATTNWSERASQVFAPIFSEDRGESSAVWRSVSAGEGTSFVYPRSALSDTNWPSSNAAWLDAMLRTDRRFNLGDLDFRSPSIADDEPSETLTTSFTDESLSDDVFSDEDFLDIEEILHDLSDYDPLDYQFLEREAGENSANDHRQTHSEASRNRNCLGAIRRMSGCRTTADGDAAETDQDAGDEGTLRHRQDVGDGMIELSHFHGLQAIPSSETGIAVVSEAAEARTNDATLLKTDRPCAKYQAFELASRPH